MHIKACRAAIKTAGSTEGTTTSTELGDGEFTALVSVFGNRDTQGDTVVKGAFTDTLSDWEKSGQPIPVIWSHQWDDPDLHIGQVVRAAETDTGLWVHARLDLDNPKARQVHRLLKGGRINQFSFGYEVLDPPDYDPRKGGELRQVRLFEVGPTLLGMNSATELLSVKRRREEPTVSAASEEQITAAQITTAQITAALGQLLKRGRVLSGTNESALRDAHTAIGRVLSQLDTDTDTDTEPEAEAEPAEESDGAPAGGQGKAPTRRGELDDEPDDDRPDDSDHDDDRADDGDDGQDDEGDNDEGDNDEDDDPKKPARPRPPARRDTRPEKARTTPDRRTPASVRFDSFLMQARQTRETH